MMREVHAMADVESEFDYMVPMIPHHMAAVIMSEQLLSQINVEHRELEELAASIRTTQTEEIRQMGLWMDKWFN